MYKEIKYINGKILSIKKLADENGVELFIPIEPANTDYQQYLKWVAEGNTPLPADEPTQGA
jgi:hypothetical protein